MAKAKAVKRRRAWMVLPRQPALTAIVGEVYPTRFLAESVRASST